MYCHHLFASLALGYVLHAGAAVVTYPVPPYLPENASALDPTPLGLSFEFFMWPSYMTNITPVVDCLRHFDDVYGRKMPIRIGGTTQDRATFDPDFDGYVSYSVDDPLIAPMTLTYGPKFFDLIPKLNTETMLGFNRGDNNRTNTYEAILIAKEKALKYLWAVELGNEPDLFLVFWNKPIATDPWTEVEEGADGANWAHGFIDIWKEPLPILSAGSYAVPLKYQHQPGWPNTDYLINTAYNETVKAATKMYCGHLYAHSNGTELSGEMNHIRTVADVDGFVKKIATAKTVNRPYIMGETNFHADDRTMDATFGAALVTLDKTMRAMSIGMQRIFFHQGTINQAYFNWWSDNQVKAPFYGGYMAALALAHGDHVIPTDSGDNPYAQYVVYKNGKPFKILLIDTNYYSGSGVRSSTAFELTGLRGRKVFKSIRMAAPSSEATTSVCQSNPAVEPTIGGRYFSNNNCAIRGASKYERTLVSGGQAKFTLQASEALLVYL